MRKIISFSLWGENPKYCVGALKNADLALQIYSGWICQFHISENVPASVVSELAKKPNVEVISHIRDEGDWNSMFWRFYPAADPDVDVMISRDCDSRLSLREKIAVDKWLESDYGFHIMRDHPYHNAPILGGMWGAKKGTIPNFFRLLENRNRSHYWQVDQEFLKSIVYPIVRYNAMVHDEFFENKKFPTERTDSFEYVGESFDENDNRNLEHVNILKKHNG